MPYRRYEDGRFALLDANGGESFPASSKWEATISKMWGKYGAIVSKLAKEFGVPAAYIVGFMVIEGGGDENACAPCQATITGSDGEQHQWCNLAPNCAPAGTKQCCAYGLVGVTNPNVVRLSKGKNIGPDLLGNPELALRYGMMIFLELWKAKGDVLVAVKSYNGGAPCQGSGTFHMGGQVGVNYVDNYVAVCNTFVSMGLAPAQSATFGSQNMLVLAAFGVLGYLGFRYLNDQYDWI